MHQKRLSEIKFNAIALKLYGRVYADLNEDEIKEVCKHAKLRRT